MRKAFSQQRRLDDRAGQTHLNCLKGLFAFDLPGQLLAAKDFREVFSGVCLTEVRDGGAAFGVGGAFYGDHRSAD